MGGLIGGGAATPSVPGRQDFLETPMFIQGPEAGAEGGIEQADTAEGAARRRGAASGNKPTGLGQIAGGRKTLLGE